MCVCVRERERGLKTNRKKTRYDLCGNCEELKSRNNKKIDRQINRMNECQEDKGITG